MNALQPQVHGSRLRNEMVTISQAAQLTGVAEHTLRAWERRYDAFRPARTPGGHRVYDADALRRIRAMQQLVAAGVPPREASDEVRRRIDEPNHQPDAATRLIDAVATLDPAAATRIIDEQFALRSFESMVDDWLMPTLVRLGSAWATGAITVAGEHLAANIVMRRLAASFDAVGPNLPPPPAIIGAPPGVDHQLGLLAFAVALRRTGTATIYLGADVPPEAWADAVATTGAAISVTTIPRRADARQAAALVERLRAAHPDVPVAVGGRFQHLAPPDCHRLGHKIAPAAREVTRLLAATA